METSYGSGAGPATAAQVLEQESLMMTQDQLRRKTMKVLVAIDESEESFLALRWALDNIFGLTGTTPEASESHGVLTVVHVQHPFQHYVFPAGPGGATFYATSSVAESIRKAQEENAAALFSRALQLCKDRMVKAETLVLEGDPKEMICQAADQMHVDLLIVGSRGLGRIKRAFLGSVSDYCAHHAVCPVLIVKPPKEHGTSKQHQDKEVKKEHPTQ